MNIPNHPPAIANNTIKNGNRIISIKGNTSLKEVLVGVVLELEDAILVEEGAYDDPEDNPLNALAIELTTAMVENHKVPIMNPKLTNEINPRNPPFTRPSE